jgi:homoserine dehydrogenase
VVADIMDIARGRIAPMFGMPATSLRIRDKGQKIKDEEDVSSSSVPSPSSSFYLRFTVADRPGVLASITDGLQREGISVESLIQHAGGQGAAQIVLTTHPAAESAMRQALTRIGALEALREKPMLIRITAS